MSELAFQETKKPKISSHDHSFSPINNPRIVLEISAVAEYFGTLFNPLFTKIKKSVFHDPQKVQNDHQKTIFLFFAISGYELYQNTQEQLIFPKLFLD